MNFSDLKLGFRGYKRDDVHQYIAYLNEDYEHKLKEKEQEAAATLQKMREEADALKREMETMRRENDTFKKYQDTMSDFITNAQDFAAELKEETRKEQMDLRKQFETRLTNNYDMLQASVTEISKFQSALTTLLKHMDESVEQARGEAENIAQELLKLSSAEQEQEEPSATKAAENITQKLLKLSAVDLEESSETKTVEPAEAIKERIMHKSLFRRQNVK